jgi:multicomponent Na+:H+ antiporter subunit C
MIFEFAFVGFAFLFTIGLCGALFWGNLFKKMLCLSVFSNSIIVFYLLLGYYKNSTFPISHGVIENIANFTNPLPSVLMLTAIVVGISVQALGFALIIRIKKDYRTLEEAEIISKIRADLS